MKIALAEMMHRAQPKRRRAILPPILTTLAQVNRLLVLYARIVRIWAEVAKQRILPAYSLTLAQNRTAIRRDSIPDIDAAIGEADERVVRAIAAFEDAFREWASDQNLHHLRILIRQIKYATGIDLETMLSAGGVERTLEEALRQNVSLVRNVSDEIRGKISGMVFRGLQRQTPLREVAKQLNEATQLGRKRVLRIASDQTVKLAASLDRERHAQLGITHFKWRHSGKAHPRKEHQARNGKVYKWESKIGREDPPGWLPFCGCKAQAVIGDEPDEAATSEPVPASVPVLPAPPPAPNFAAIDDEMAAFVRNNGKAKGVEFLAAYDEDLAGKEVSRYSTGEAAHVGFSPEFIAAMERAGARIVGHHNHPSSSSFSGADINSLYHWPGMRRLYAHGHDGTSYVAEIANRQISIPALLNRLKQDVHGELQTLVTRGQIEPMTAWRTENHVIMLILRELGAITYDVTSPSADNATAWDRTGFWIRKWVGNARDKYKSWL